MGTLTMKFGGAAVGTVAALTQAVSIIIHEHHRQEALLVVVSALEGVTDSLLQAAQLAEISNQRGYRRIAATLRTRHMALVEQLPLDTAERNTLQADVDRLLFEMLDACQQLSTRSHDGLGAPGYSDLIVSIGERLAARIVAALLRQNQLRGVAIDATDLIITDDVFGYATPDLIKTGHRIQEYLLPMLKRDIIPVVTGYIGATTSGHVTTMGRGGSDYSASILSQCINADEVWMWSDVDGMMSADPIDMEDARVIEQLSYDEVAELAYFGAHILHPRMITPLQEMKIPLRVKNIYKPGQAGTLVLDSDHTEGVVKAVTTIQAIGMKAARSGSVDQLIQTVDRVFFAETGSHVDVMIASQSSAHTFLCFIIPTPVNVQSTILVEAIEEALAQQPDNVHWQIEPVRVVTVIGEKINQKPQYIAHILATLDTIRLSGFAPGPNGSSLSLIFGDSDDAKQALEHIHQLILKND